MTGFLRRMNTPAVYSIALVVAVSIACGGGEPEAPQAPACDLSIDHLEGQTFLMLEALPDKTSKPNKRVRMKFVKEDGVTTAKYTVGSLSDVIDYPCTMREKEGKKTLYCAEKERAADWCQALEVYEMGTCSKKALRELGIEKLTDDELNAEIKKAKETVKKYRNTENWKRFELNNNNLGNKLQGRLYVEVDEKRCRLTVTDMYFTVYDGKGIEDTNPTGINPFVKTDDVYLFEHCDKGDLAALKTMERPEDFSQVSRREEHEVGKDVFYHYAGENAVKAEEGCTYSFDTWAQWEKGSEGNEAPISDDKKTKGMIDWHTKHQYAADDIISYNGQPVGVFNMVRYKKCDGKEREKIDSVCNASIVR